MKVEKRPWGEISVISDTPTTLDGKVIYSYGEITIKPYELIPLHLHTDDFEGYIPRTRGIKILVIPEAKFHNQNGNVTVANMKELKPAKIGTEIICPKGYAHALYNDSEEPGIVEFLKYRA